jgi:hypothetical protein
MDGGVKYHPSVVVAKKIKQTYKNKNHGISVRYRNIPKRKLLKTIKKRPLNLKKDVEELIQKEIEPNIFLPKAIELIKNILKASKKSNRKVDTFVVSLVYSLYYALKKENSINYNSNATDAENMNENTIWNDPYKMLRTLVTKLEELMETDNDEFKLEITEAIKEGLEHGYDKVYKNNVDELADLFSGTRV